MSTHNTPGAALRAAALAALLLGAAACARYALAPRPAAETEPRAASRDPHRTGVRVARLSRFARAGAAPCPPVQAGRIYRFVAGVDACLAPMSADSAARLNDPWAVNVLRRNAGGQGLWPATVASVVTAVAQSPVAYKPTSYLVGEGSQIDSTITPVSNTRALRYVVTFGPTTGPVIFLSARPAGVAGGTPPDFLQVASLDPVTKKYNYYQYVNNAAVDAPAADSTRTWAWAGDSDAATAPATAANGCFQCHLNGGLNMKELTVPWNNWNSSSAAISAANVPEAMRTDSLFLAMAGAPQLQTVFQGQALTYTNSWVARNVANGAAANVPLLLRRLIQTTTVNFASSQTPATSAGAVTPIPNDFFLFDSALRNVLKLGYTLNLSSMPGSAYTRFVQDRSFQLYASNGDPPYRKPGGTFFSWFVPVPAFEDVKAIQALLASHVVSAKFATAVLMVDFTNPVFSPVRTSLQQYADQIPAGRADSTDIPTRFAALVTAAAAAQPACDTTALGGCTAEQQFLYFWNSSNTQAAAVSRVNAYTAALSARAASQAGQDDLMTLMVSRGVQFQNFWPVCNLAEFSLLLPQTSAGNVFVRMNPDATISPQPAYTCTPPG